jgi:hypothetical protein
VVCGTVVIKTPKRSRHPGYLGARDQEDRGSKPALANSFKRPFLEKNHHKKGWWSGSRCLKKKKRILVNAIFINSVGCSNF